MAKRAARLDDEDEDDVPAPANYVAPPEPWQTDDCDAARAVRKVLDAFEVGEIDTPTRFTLHRIYYRADRWLQLGVPRARPGREDVTMVLRCIVESTNGEEALTELIVRSVAGTISEFEHHGLALIEAFDQIPLLRIVDMMRELEYFRRGDAVLDLSAILRNKLRRILSPPQPEPVKAPSAKERLAADKQATAAAKRRLVEQKIEVGRKLAALRDTIPNNRRFGSAVRKQFGLDNSLEVAEMMRVARRYGDRPEIFSQVGWRVLKELASSVTPEAQRRKFEARISAGERVDGAEIIRARATIGARTPRRLRPNVHTL